MRFSCPPASGTTKCPQYRYGAISSRSGNEREQTLASSPLRCYQQQTNRLTGLYQQSKNRNQRLLQLSLNLSSDVNFLKEYCRCLQLELERDGFYQQKQFERLSRRETAATIFENYSDSESLLSDWRDEENDGEELLRLRSRNTSLEQENKQLTEKVGKVGQKGYQINRAVQVDTLQLERMKSDSRIAQETIKKLTDEVSHLSYTNGALTLQKRRRGLQASLLDGSQQIFNRMHEIMREYRRKMNALAHEKKDIERKCRVLKENVRLTETGNQLKLIDLLTEKIDILQKLIEKQQVEIETTIGVYESELGKIEEKRKEEVEYFEQERIGLETENLKLCMNVQKALNRQDSANLLLLQERNVTDRMNNQMVKLTQNIQQIESKGREGKVARLRLESGVSKFCGENFQSQTKIIQSQIIQSVHSAGYRFSNIENSNHSNFQFSDLEEGGHSREIEDLGRSKQAFSRVKKGGGGPEKITITYNSPYVPYGVHLSQHSNPTRGCDSAVQYKRRFVQEKPDIISRRK